MEKAMLENSSALFAELSCVRQPVLLCKAKNKLLCLRPQRMICREMVYQQICHRMARSLLLYSQSKYLDAWLADFPGFDAKVADEKLFRRVSCRADFLNT